MSETLWLPKKSSPPIATTVRRNAWTASTPCASSIVLNHMNQTHDFRAREEGRVHCSSTVAP